LYFKHKKRFRQLTKDHSLVQELVDAGDLKPEMAWGHPSQNMITRALGTSNPCPDIGKSFKISYGDQFLLCTDGLTKALRDSTISDLMLNEDTKKACQRLVFEANKTDGSDNITVQLINIMRPKG
jgi:serine/threonine protein phosphatase PrpC